MQDNFRNTLCEMNLEGQLAAVEDSAFHGVGLVLEVTLRPLSCRQQLVQNLSETILGFIYQKSFQVLPTRHNFNGHY